MIERRLVLHCAKRWDAGGVTSVALDIASLLSDSYAPVFWALRRGDWDGRVAELYEIHIGLQSAVGLMSRATVIHSHHRVSSLVALILGRKAKLVDHVHNYFANWRLVSFRGSVVVAVSNSVAESLRRHYPHVARVIRVVENFVVARPGESLTRRESRVRSPRFIAVGRLSMQKDPVRFARLAAVVQKRRPTWQFSWIGDGELRDEVESTAAREGASMEVLGWRSRSEVAAMMADSTMLVLTSRWEGLPMVAIEALSVGVPVATTPAGDLAEVVAGVGAGVVFSGDLSLDAAALEAALVPEALSAMEVAASQVFAQRYSGGRAKREWSEIYASIGW